MLEHGLRADAARADQLFDGRKIRALTVVDNFSRQCVAIHVGQSLKGEDVVAVMDRLRVHYNGVPERIQVDNGSEFISKALDLCGAARAGVRQWGNAGLLPAWQTD